MKEGGGGGRKSRSREAGVRGRWRCGEGGLMHGEGRVKAGEELGEGRKGEGRGGEGREGGE